MHALDLRHYTDEPLKEIETVDQSKPPAYFSRGFAKPVGLWVSVKGEYDWPAWIEECSSWRVGQHEYKVTLQPDAKLLHLTSPEELDAFTKKWADKKHPSWKWGQQLAKEHNEHFSQMIKANPELTELLKFRQPMISAIMWPKVAKEYQGIIISPYQWERRDFFGTFWYSGWDCASGCIWDKEAIKSIIRVSNDQATG